MYGYMGKILRVDLGGENIKEETLCEEYARKYIGGSGLASRIIYDELDFDSDPLSPDNILIFATGPFQGTGIPFSGRYEVCSKSPLTGIWAEASSGGYFGPALKRTGYDAIVIEGRASKPVYLYITEYGIEIKDASRLWGKDSYVTEIKLRKELDDPDVEILCIGQGGENLVKFASIMNDLGRSAGRSGNGAVMGSKNLKAIAVNGKKSVEVAEPNKLLKLIKAVAKLGKNSPISPLLAKYGTSMLLDILGPTGDVPYKYWTESDGKKGKNTKMAESIGGGRMYRELLTKNYYCSTCPIGCGRIVKVTSSAEYAMEGHGPEYSTGAAIGTLCMIDDISAIAKGNDILNRRGIDSIETGSLIAFAMACYEKGWITKEDTDGIDLTWGNAEAMLKMIEKISKRDGFGDVLADGLLPAAEKIGHNSSKIVMHSKGQAFSMHDPRTFNGLALSYGTSERGACHLHGMGWVEIAGFGFSPYRIASGKMVKKHSLNGQALSTIVTQAFAEINNSLVQCIFSFMGLMTPKIQAALLSAVTGWDVSDQDLIKTGERIFNLKRLFNCRFGVERIDDIIPEMVPVAASGGYVPKGKELEEALDEYYDLNGWTRNGIPTSAKMLELGIEDVKEILP